MYLKKKYYYTETKYGFFNDKFRSLHYIHILINHN